MTSAQNLLRQSSGNSPILWVFVLLVISSCSIFRPTTNRKDADTTSQPSEDVTKTSENEVDTIRWTKTDESEVPPIVDRSSVPTTEMKSSYNVVLVAPFAARDFQNTTDRLTGRMSRMLEFYAGLKYSWQSSTSGVEVNLTVVDSRKDPDFIEHFSDDPSFIDADVIIGPYFTEELKALAAFASQRQKVLMSPWNTTAIADENPYYIQLRPNLKQHADALTQFIRDQHRGEEVLVMCKNDIRDSITLTYFAQAERKYQSGDTLTRFTEMKIDEISDPELSEEMLLLVDENGLRTFVVPNWSDEPFVISALAKINYAKADNDVTVYGLPQWMAMSKMDFNYYENLNVHVSTESPLKFQSDAAKRLKEAYFEQYGVLPSAEVHYGHDVMLLVTTLLREYGSLITNGLASIDQIGDHRFAFVSIFGADGERINHHENRYIQIVKFEDFRFEPAGE